MCCSNLNGLTDSNRNVHDDLCIDLSLCRDKIKKIGLHFCKEAQKLQLSALQHCNLRIFSVHNSAQNNTITLSLSQTNKAISAIKQQINVMKAINALIYCLSLLTMYANCSSTTGISRRLMGGRFTVFCRYEEKTAALDMAEHTTVGTLREEAATAFDAGGAVCLNFAGAELMNEGQTLADAAIGAEAVINARADPWLRDLETLQALVTGAKAGKETRIKVRKTKYTNDMITIEQNEVRRTFEMKDCEIFSYVNLSLLYPYPDHFLFDLQPLSLVGTFKRWRNHYQEDVLAER